MPLNGGHIDIDVSDATRKVALARSLLSEEKFKKVMYRTFGETARKVRSIVAKETVKDYVTKQKDVRAAVGNYNLAYGGIEGLNVMVHCTIPITGVKGGIGTKFRATGGTGRPRLGVRQIIKAKIVKSGISTLPATLPNQGGNPPFRSPKTRVVYTRKTAARLPIVRVVALGVPQFPLNRSEGDVRSEIESTLEKRFEHNVSRELGFRI